MLKEMETSTVDTQGAEYDVLNTKTAEEVLQWVFETFGDRGALMSSFGLEDVVLIDMMAKINPKARIVTLDTGRLNQETYDVMDKIRDKYAVPIEVMFPDARKVEEMVRTKGINLFYHSLENRKECCRIRKVDLLNRALAGLDAWVTGLRRAQVVTRTETKKVEIDHDHGEMTKINPIADWAVNQVWDYVKANHIPFNVLHERGYPSIGCAPCTRAISTGEDLRAGRWWWELPEHKECGLHVQSP